ncbi:ROK family protein [Paenibacillus sediminis]|uniref:Glucokinase n=1 Tax=Paenibacillus sediminis TaxID=664909 RepID=A0ABS4GZF9_9BACL|nr:ROK family protein [Paenibacillus sediminis]MBP1935275.1 glucokinase [Paenibacillus sediminis]
MAMQTIGIDIGGTSIKGIVMNSQGEKLGEIQQPTDAALGKKHIVLHVQEVTQQLLRRFPHIATIGIGTAGVVDVNTGQIVYATDNLPGWHGFRLKQWAEERFGRKVIVDNDANVALAGEYWLGAGKDCSDLTMLTLGTGVGGANMIRGEIYRGANWTGGEWGHVIFTPRGRPCNCGMEGCIEQYISGTALVRSAQEAANVPYASGHEVFADFAKGNPAIARVVGQFVRDLALIIHNIHNGLNPGRIIIGGGIVDAKSFWWDLLEKQLNLLPSKIEVRPAVLGNQAGAIGAARLAMLTKGF